MDIKNGRRFQGREILGINKMQLNTDGRKCFGFRDWRIPCLFGFLQICSVDSTANKAREAHFALKATSAG